VSDTAVLVLTALLAVGVLGWTVWTIWHIARRAPTRQRALTHVLGSMAGTALLGVVVPAALKGALDPFPIWLAYAAATAAAAAVLGWRWPALSSGNGRHPSLVITSLVLLLILAMAGVAVT
jgi:CDP-diglyceride synthetase